MNDLKPGQMLGPYRIIGHIGKGGMSTVYKAYHANMDRYVVVKVLALQFSQSEEFLGRFQQEARLIARLEHPHILPVYDSGECDHMPYLVMRYMESGTLKDRLKIAALSLEEIDPIFSQLADALAYAHENGIIHRDIKPSNVMLDKQGNIYLTDFGIAKLVKDSPQLTSPGSITGTPDYMSPEQAQGDKVDQRADIYSLGIILYEMLTGKVPFEAETPLAVILKKIQDPLPLPSTINPNILPELETVVLKALAKDPKDRFQTTRAFLEAWKKGLSGPSKTSRPIPESKQNPDLRYYYPTIQLLSSTPLESSAADRKRVFLSYKRGIETDEALALYLYAALSRQCDVFIDQEMTIGTDWRERIQSELEASDFLIPLLSPQSAHSEMVSYEIGLAHNLSQAGNGRPAILPVRVAFTEPFDYPLSAYLNHLNWALWRSDKDNAQLLNDLMIAIKGGELQLADVLAKSAVMQNVPVDCIPQPTPYANPARLESPYGTMDPESIFYIERAGDIVCQREMQRQGTTIVIKAPRQMGKSSLLVRIARQANHSGRSVAFLDFQLLDEIALSQADRFFKGFCHWITSEFDLVDTVENFWQIGLGNVQLCTKYIQNQVLKKTNGPLVLAMDEVDRLLNSPFRSDFFGMLRNWHNSRRIGNEWNRLDLLLVISTEPYLLIDDLKQSPFNVGEVIRLENFTREQVTDLNQRHGNPFSSAQITRLMDLLGGHPYLVRQALYRVACEEISAEMLLKQATDDAGPFGDHLRRLWVHLGEHPDLLRALSQVINSHTCSDPILLNRLYGAGLVHRQGEIVLPRCELYTEYYRGRLSLE
jgi:serine/threonine protein kinase